MSVDGTHKWDNEFDGFLLYIQFSGNGNCCTRMGTDPMEWHSLGHYKEAVVEYHHNMKGHLSTQDQDYPRPRLNLKD